MPVKCEMQKVKVKICGITDYREAAIAVGLGVDALGFIFAKSPRQITPQKALAIIRDLPRVNIPLNGAEAYLLQGSDNQLVFFEFTKDTEIPMHSHGAQWGIVVDGMIDLTIGGEERTYRKGDSYSIPSGILHGGRIYAGFKAIDFFADRDRYTPHGT